MEIGKPEPVPRRGEHTGRGRGASTQVANKFSMWLIALRAPSRLFVWRRARAVDHSTSLMRSWSGLSFSLFLRSMRSPSTGVALLRVAWRFRARGWNRRFPFLPLPAKDYVRWRMYTAYGDERIVPPADDVVRYARWAVRKS
jgi:hypothetical protein